MAIGVMVGVCVVILLQAIPTSGAPGAQGAILATSTYSPTPVPASPTPAPKPKLGTGASSALTTATSAASPYGFAIGDEFLQLSDAALAASFADMRSMGIGWVRFDISWTNVAPNGPGQYQWSGYDRVVKAARSRNLAIIGILDYTPEWARQSACAGEFTCMPADPGQYARYAADTAAHYAPLGVNVWEIWNEPNITPFFSPKPNPAQYVSLLRAAYPAIKRVNSSATVLTGGLSPAGTHGGNYSPPDFLNLMYANGARGYFDAVAHHPYTYPDTPARNNPYDAWGQLQELRNSMVAHGDGGKLIWLTEYGAPTNGPGNFVTSANYNQGGDVDHIDEALQAIMMRDVIASYRTKSWVGPIMWYTYKDSGSSTETAENFYGVIRANGSRKPAYDAFIQATK
jgi:polysaccharide biosynthesis protein PslG